MTDNRMGLKKEDDLGLSAQLEVLEAMTSPGDAENQQLICLLLELKRRRVNQQAIEAELQEYRKASSEPVVITHDMAMAFHNALNDGGIGHEDLEEISIGLRAALANYAAPPLQAVTVPDGWTGSDKANAALIMLDRIETTDPVDDDRIEGIKRIVRELAAAPQPSSKSLQLGSTTEAAPVLDSTTYITMPSSTLKWPD